MKVSNPTNSFIELIRSDALSERDVAILLMNGRFDTMPLLRVYLRERFPRLRGTLNEYHDFFVEKRLLGISPVENVEIHWSGFFSFEVTTPGDRPSGLKINFEWVPFHSFKVRSQALVWWSGANQTVSFSALLDGRPSASRRPLMEMPGGQHNFRDAIQYLNDWTHGLLLEDLDYFVGQPWVDGALQHFRAWLKNDPNQFKP